MADAVALRNALERCGFNAASRAHFMGQGFPNVTAYQQLPAGQPTKNLWKDLSRSTVPDGVSFPYFAKVKAQGLRAFLEYQDVRGFALNANAYTDVADAGVITKWTKRVTEMDTFAEREETAPKMPELKGWSQWETYEEAIMASLGYLRNPTTGVPLTYLLREHDEVTDEILDAAYTTIDDDLIATTLYEGDQYELDNQRLYGLFEPSVRNGVGWNYAKQHQKARNGRLAWMAVKMQATGQAASQRRKDDAYAQIANAEFTGRGRQTMRQYIDWHVGGSNELTKLGEPIPETKRCTDFLKGITDPAMRETVVRYQADAEERTNFDNLQQKVLSAALQIHAKERGRGVASLATKPPTGPGGRHGRRGPGGRGGHGGRGGRGGGRGGKDKKAKAKKPRIHAGHYEVTEWSALSEDEQQKVFKLREEKKRKAAAAGIGDDDSRTIDRVSTKQVAFEDEEDKKPAATDDFIAQWKVAAPRTETDLEIADAFEAFSAERRAMFANKANKDGSTSIAAAKAAVVAKTFNTIVAAKAALAEKKAAEGKSADTKEEEMVRQTVAASIAEERDKSKAGNQFGRFAHPKVASTLQEKPKTTPVKKASPKAGLKPAPAAVAPKPAPKVAVATVAKKDAVIDVEAVIPKKKDKATKQANE